VLVAAYEARINREYQRISVWPRIQQSSSFIPGQPYLRVVSNVGVGPALIRSVQVSVDGEPRRTWPEIIQVLVGQPVRGHVYTSLKAGSVVLASKDINVLELPPGEEAKLFWEQIGTPRVSIQICYSSLYGESWVSDSREPQPRPVASCQPDPAKEFEQ
jgi:hypothetical protein